ncbi:MAG: anti-sigma factor [Bacteroidota bacterium]
MDLRAYIESGILEAYVNGLLSDAENQEVDEMVRQHPEIRRELSEIQESLRAFAPVANGPQMPELSLIMEQVVKEPLPEVASVDHQEPPPAGKVRSLRLLQMALAAAILLLLLSVTSLYKLNEQVDQLSSRVVELEQEQTYFSQQYEVMRREPLVIEQAQAVINDPGSEPFTLTSNSSEQSKVQVFWHNSRDVYLMVEQLPEPPEGMQHQLWAVINGVSVNAGVFEHHLKMQKLVPVEGDIAAFMVTLEKKGGSPNPNLNKVLVKSI